MELKHEIKLRVSKATDAEFAFKTIKETMKDYAIATWGEWYEEDSHKSAIKDTQSGKVEIIELNGISIGVLLVTRNSSEIEIEQIYILPKFQNNGIGTKLIKEIQKEAKELAVPLKLHVLLVNPVNKLYERLGFNIVRETNERRYMEFMP